MHVFLYQEIDLCVIDFICSINHLIVFRALTIIHQ